MKPNTSLSRWLARLWSRQAYAEHPLPRANSAHRPARLFHLALSWDEIDYSYWYSYLTPGHSRTPRLQSTHVLGDFCRPPTIVSDMLGMPAYPWTHIRYQSALSGRQLAGMGQPPAFAAHRVRWRVFLSFLFRCLLPRDYVDAEGGSYVSQTNLA